MRRDQPVELAAPERNTAISRRRVSVEGGDGQEREESFEEQPLAIIGIDEAADQLGADYG